MKRLTMLGAAFALALLPVTAAAQAGRASDSTRYNRYKIHRDSSGGYNILDAVACDAVAGDRTVTLYLGASWVGIKFNVQYDYSAGGAATAIVLTCEESLDGTNYGNKTTSACTTGNCTKYSRMDTFAVSSTDTSLVLKMDTEAAWRLRCVFSCTGGNANENLTVQATSFIGR